MLCVASRWIVISIVYFPFELFFWIFFFLLLLFLLLCCIAPFEELVFFLFIFLRADWFLPCFFLIFGWGYQPECVQAGIYLLFYALLASLPLLVGILFVYNSLVSLCLFLLCTNSSLVGSFSFLPSSFLPSSFLLSSLSSFLPPSFLTSFIHSFIPPSFLLSSSFLPCSPQSFIHTFTHDNKIEMETGRHYSWRYSNWLWRLEKAWTGQWIEGFQSDVNLA